LRAQVEVTGERNASGARRLPTAQMRAAIDVQDLTRDCHGAGQVGNQSQFILPLQSSGAVTWEGGPDGS
jgi:hypothetical protein